MFRICHKYLVSTMLFRKLSVKLGFLAVFVGLITIFFGLSHFVFLVSQPRQSSHTQELSSSQPESKERAVSIISEPKDNKEVLSPKKILCEDTISSSYFEQRGDYWVLSNYFQASKRFHCDESITYTTHAEYSYLDNLIDLVDRWQGPVSLAVYTPGWDFRKAVKTVAYLRECSPSPLIKELVTFHLYFDNKRRPKQRIYHNSTSIKVDCKYNPMKLPRKGTYRYLANLTYPVNMGRMIARDLATTHYVLASDIELYPNPGLILDFLDMIARDDPVLRSPNPKVFPIAIFEIDESVKDLPRDKSELVKLLQEETAIPFHKNVCSSCHSIPHDGHTNWADTPFYDGFMNIYHVAKRQWKHKYWEPIYIGTKQEPGYDIRLHWEGQRDKMTQGYVLCVLDYEFLILDNAFLIHKPGIKYLPSKHSEKQVKLLQAQLALIRGEIARELNTLYGKRKGCVLP